MKEFRVAIAGVTGAVGQEMLKVLEERNFPVSELRPLASSRSQGKKVLFQGKEWTVEALSENSFQGVDIALFSAGASVSREFAPLAAQSGCVVIDNSSAFRQDPDIPLIIPEINPHRIKDYSRRNIIANPNCTTTISLMPLKPLHDYGKIKRIVAASYQATSGAGAEAMAELEEQVRAYVNQEEIVPRVFPQQIAFNVIPHIDTFLDNYYTKEEMKMVWESRKILEEENLLISTTCVRVPVFRAHSVAINIETERKITRGKAIELLSSFPGVKVVDDPKHLLYPTPLMAVGKDECLVGRIREDISSPSGLSIWVVGDQLRKGAALNAVQIAELLAREIS